MDGPDLRKVSGSTNLRRFRSQGPASGHFRNNVSLAPADYVLSALAILAFASAGAVVAQTAVSNEGITFPDGSMETTAPGQEFPRVAGSNFVVTFSYTDGQTGERRTATLPGEEFLWRIVQQQHKIAAARDLSFFVRQCSRLVNF